MEVRGGRRNRGRQQPDERTGGDDPPLLHPGAPHRAREPRQERERDHGQLQQDVRRSRGIHALQFVLEPRRREATPVADEGAEHDERRHGGEDPRERPVRAVDDAARGARSPSDQAPAADPHRRRGPDVDLPHAHEQHQQHRRQPEAPRARRFAEREEHDRRHEQPREVVGKQPRGGTDHVDRRDQRQREEIGEPSSRAARDPGRDRRDERATDHQAHQPHRHRRSGAELRDRRHEDVVAGRRRGQRIRQVERGERLRQRADEPLVVRGRVVRRASAVVAAHDQRERGHHQRERRKRGRPQ